MAEQRCPNCGAELPPELGQHALQPETGLVQCPSCGEKVELERPKGPDSDVSADVPRSTETVGGESGAPESFSGEDTVEGVMEELKEKPGGPEGAT